MADGFASTVALVVDDKLIEGDQTYVEAPDAESVVVWPLQIGASIPAFTIGKLLTVTVTLSVFWQPFASTPVTVYVVRAIGFAETEAPETALNPVDGVQE